MLDLREVLQISVRPNHSLEDEAPEHELQVRHLRKDLLQVVQRGQAHRHHPQRRKGEHLFFSLSTIPALQCISVDDFAPINS